MKCDECHVCLSDSMKSIIVCSSHNKLLTNKPNQSNHSPSSEEQQPSSYINVVEKPIKFCFWKFVTLKLFLFKAKEEDDDDETTWKEFKENVVTKEDILVICLMNFSKTKVMSF